MCWMARRRIEIAEGDVERMVLAVDADVIALVSGLEEGRRLDGGWGWWIERRGLGGWWCGRLVSR